MIKLIRCVHCLEYFEKEKTNEDHVFPKSWYPDATPDDIEKWTMPSCVECNKQHGNIENDILIRLGLTLPPDNPHQDIKEKAWRAIDPNSARDEKDRKCRLSLREKMKNSLRSEGSFPLSAVLPTKGSIPKKTNRAVITIPANSLHKICEKFIRGINYVIENIYIENNFEIKTFFVHEMKAIDVENLLKKFGKVYARGPAITIKRAETIDDSKGSLYYIDFWSHLYMYGTVIPTSKL